MLEPLPFGDAIVEVMWVMVTIAIILDLISGIKKAKQRGEGTPSSYGLKRTVSKAVLYYSLMFFALMFDCIGTFFYPLPYITFISAGFLIFIEGRSILEKAHENERYKLNKNMELFALFLENKDDITKALAEIIKNKGKNGENNTPPA